MAWSLSSNLPPKCARNNARPTRANDDAALGGMDEAVSVRRMPPEVGVGAAAVGHGMVVELGDVGGVHGSHLFSFFVRYFVAGALRRADFRESSLTRCAHTIK